MPVFQVDIQVDFYSEYITNRYHIDSSTMAAAGAEAGAIAALHAKLLPPSVAIDTLRVSTPTPGDNQFYTIPVSIPGTRPATSQTMPPFCRYRVDFSIGYRRPLRKFLLIPFEEDTDGSQFNTAALVRVANDYITPLVALGTVCNEEGLPILSGTLDRRVGMRQLRRGSKRKLQPVI